MDGSSGTGTVVPDHGTDAVTGVAAVASVGPPVTASARAYDRPTAAARLMTCAAKMTDLQGSDDEIDVLSVRRGCVR
jgi:hypothetical protein